MVVGGGGGGGAGEDSGQQVRIWGKGVVNKIKNKIEFCMLEGGRDSHFWVFRIFIIKHGT